MDSQKQPAVRTKALSAEDKLIRNYNEIFSTEKTYVDSMKDLAKELTRLRDTGFVIEAEGLKGKKSNKVKVSDEDYAVLTDLIKIAEGLAFSPLLDPPINKGDFNSNFKELMERTLPGSEPFQNYLSKISDYTLQYEYITKTAANLSEKYLNKRYQIKANKESQDEVNTAIKNKLVELSTELIKPIQRGPRYDILFKALHQNLTSELLDIKDRLAENHQHIQAEMIKINERKRKGEAFIDQSMYFTQSNLLKNWVEVIDKRYQEKNIKIDSLPAENQPAMPALLKKFEGISRFRGIAFSKEGWEKKFEKVNSTDPVNDPIYQVFSPNERLLYKAFAQLKKLNAEQTEEIGKLQKIIDDLIKLINLEHKKAYVVKAKEISAEMKKEVESLLKKGILSKSDFKGYGDRIQQLEKNYLMQQKEIRDEITKVESRLNKSTSVARSKDAIKHEIKKERRESVPAPLGTISLPPDTPQPALPRGAALPPGKLPPPLSRAEKPDRSLDDELAAVPPPTDIPPPPSPASEKPDRSLDDELAAVPPPTDIPPPPSSASEKPERSLADKLAAVPPPTDIPPPPSPASDKTMPSSQDDVPPPKYIPSPPPQEKKNAALRSKTQNIPQRGHLSTTADLFVSMNGKPEVIKASRPKTSWINRLSTKISSQTPQQKSLEKPKEIPDEETKGDSSSPKKNR